MGYSTVYDELKAMIEKSWLQKSMSAFDQMLEQLVKGGHITAEERRSLMELYIKTYKDQE